MSCFRYEVVGFIVCGVYVEPFLTCSVYMIWEASRDIGVRKVSGCHTAGYQQLHLWGIKPRCLFESRFTFRYVSKEQMASVFRAEISWRRKHCSFLCLILFSWMWRRHDPPKRGSALVWFQRVIAPKTEMFVSYSSLGGMLMKWATRVGTCELWGITSKSGARTVQERCKGSAFWGITSCIPVRLLHISWPSADQLTNLSPISLALLVAQILKNAPTFYGTRSLIAVFIVFITAFH
jgi:hypothetical protein